MSKKKRSTTAKPAEKEPGKETAPAMDESNAEPEVLAEVVGETADAESTVLTEENRKDAGTEALNDLYRGRWEASSEKGQTPLVSLKGFCIAAVSIILSIGLCAGSFWAYHRLQNGDASNPQADALLSGDVMLVSAAPKTPADALSVQEMIATCKPGVVCINIVKTDATTGVASGFVVSDKGYIVTNKHVIETPASMSVLTADGNSYAASLIGSDELSDIAVLKIDAENLVPLTLGDSSLVQQGDYVVAIGTPASAEFACSATFGIISGTNRSVQMKDNAGNVTKTYTVLQTDASINPGNSGGPLINVYGQVIGINSLKLSTDSYESIGFALPINGAIAVTNQIIAKGRVSDRPQDDYVRGATVFGAQLKTYSQTDATASSLVPGVYVYTVDQGGPAEAAGVAMGDIITSFDGAAVLTVSDVTKALLQKKPGDAVSLSVYRNRQTLNLTVTLAAYSD